jgi:hypothetical protein
MITNVYEDFYLTNGVRRTQQVQRVLAQPDILFTAADLGITVDGFPIYYQRTGGAQLVSQDTLNGTSTLGGPGVIRPPITMVYSKIGEYLINIGDGGEPDGQRFYWWGSFDGTTNEPVMYPQGSSIKALEWLVMSGRLDEQLNPWRNP